ncbi:hypothetical protein FH972_023549 [Carpinus fangiana]|uniref:Uncharacterized protein n=1 Tax=Carpinus fangiana TaxID=176857 RepID=A0A5N6KW41_9ROSI|nr:hypothetical protein FH972_023549 [Carpinus fangiana]
MASGDDTPARRMRNILRQVQTEDQDSPENSWRPPHVAGNLAPYLGFNDAVQPPTVSRPGATRHPRRPARGSRASQGSLRPPRSYVEEERNAYNSQRTRSREELINLIELRETGERLAQVNEDMRSILERPIPSPTLVRQRSEEDAAAAGGRRKRRRLDGDVTSRTYYPITYGNQGQVVAGKLKMQLVSTDGGIVDSSDLLWDRSAPQDKYAAANVLRDDQSVYCTLSSHCNMVFQHQGQTPFTLEKLVIKAPSHVRTHPRTTVQQRDDSSDDGNDSDSSAASSSSSEASVPLQEESLHPLVMGMIDSDSEDEAFPPIRLEADADNYNALNNTGNIAHHAQHSGPLHDANNQATLAQIMRHSQIWLQRLHGTDNSDGTGIPHTANAAIDTEESWDERRDRAGQSTSHPRAASNSLSTHPSPHVRPPHMGNSADLLTPDARFSMHHPTAADYQHRPRKRKVAKWFTRSEPRVHDRPGRKDDRLRPRSLEMVDEQGPRPRHGIGSVLKSETTEQGRQIDYVHVRTTRTVQKKNTITISFDPPISTRFVLLKLWNTNGGGGEADGKRNIDIQSVQAVGWAGPRWFPSTVMR